MPDSIQNTKGQLSSRSLLWTALAAQLSAKGQSFWKYFSGTPTFQNQQTVPGSNQHREQALTGPRTLPNATQLSHSLVQKLALAASRMQEPGSSGRRRRLEAASGVDAAGEGVSAGWENDIDEGVRVWGGRGDEGEGRDD